LRIVQDNPVIFCSVFPVNPVSDSKWSKFVPRLELFADVKYFLLGSAVDAVCPTSNVPRKGSSSAVITSRSERRYSIVNPVNLPSQQYLHLVPEVVV
jgi:hypothetical protein